MAAGYASYGDPPPPPVPPRYAAAPVYYYPAVAATRSVKVPLPPPEPASAEPDQPPEFYAPISELEQWDLAQTARGCNVRAVPGRARPFPLASHPSFRKSI